jgi:hypothetical protein
MALLGGQLFRNDFPYHTLTSDVYELARPLWRDSGACEKFMITFWLNAFWLSVSLLEAEMTTLKLAERSGLGNTNLPRERLSAIDEALKAIEISLQDMNGGFLNSVICLARLRPRLSLEQQWPIVRMIEALQGLKDQIMFDANGHTWARIDSEFRSYFVSPNVWGDAIFEALPHAHEDIRDAGHSIGCELYTAAVFHLMRVAEHGLRELAKHLRVKLRDKGMAQPVDHATWDKVITAARNQISSARLLAAGPKKKARLAKYARAADHCDYMKDIWRNDVAHTQRSYNRKDALAVLARVREFTELVASFKPPMAG